MQLTFLSGPRPLTKAYVFSDPTTYDSTPYPLTSEFTSHVEEISTIEDFYAVLHVHGKSGHCLLKGNLQKNLVRSSRAGLIAQEPTKFLVLDFDGLDLGDKTLDDVLTSIGLGNVDYVLQYSASHGIKPFFNAHVFMLLAKAAAAEELKSWLKWKNLTVPFLRGQLALTKSNMALHWPIDVTVGQSDKLLYIAPPLITGIADPVPNRLHLVKKNERTAQLDLAPAGLDEQAKDLIKQLRSVAGLPELKLSTVLDKYEHVEVLKDPDRVAVTGVKRSAEFTYLNINHGDSFGYYHSTKVPRLLYNFKGEPVYRLADIAAGYYKEALAYAKEQKLEAHRPEEDSTKIQRWVANLKKSSKYVKVTYRPGIGVDIDPANSVKVYEDWCKLHGLPIPEAVEDWDVVFDPTSDKVIDAQERIINIYKPTKYKVRAKPDLLNCPDDYFKLIKHVCGSDEEATNRFINWLAFLWQLGRKPKTAWVMHGQFGTGKGRLAKVLQALFGEHFVSTSPEHVGESFNTFIEKAQILWIDEVTTESWDSKRMVPKLRNWITEDFISMRRMQQAARDESNYMGIIIAANEHNVVEIPRGDRRFNVAPRQEVPLLNMPWATSEMLDDFYGTLYQETNLQAFANYLTAVQVDTSMVRVPLENAAKRAVADVTQQLPAEIVSALQDGNVGYFIDFARPVSPILDVENDAYLAIVRKMLRGGEVPMKTLEIQQLFSYIAGATWESQKIGRFTKAASKYGLLLGGKTVRDGDRTYSGVKMTFNPTPSDHSRFAQYADTGLKVVRDVREE